MKVYVVLDGVAWEGAEVDSVHDNRERAEARARWIDARNNESRCYYTQVLEFEINKMPEPLDK
jgi:hypothetical protein